MFRQVKIMNQFVPIEFHQKTELLLSYFTEKLVSVSILKNASPS